MGGVSEKTATATARVSTQPLLLPQDILVEILSKLPAKSLVRFRCVSKFFCALIADHGFGVLHRSLSLTLPTRRAGILIAIISPEPKQFSLRSPHAYYTINFSEENPQQPGMLQPNRLGYLDAEPFLEGCLHSSWDGLICLSRPNGDIVVCNVCTGQRISLPTIQFHFPHPYLCCAQLGFDSQSKRYKVLMSACMIDQGSRPIRYEYKHWVLTLGVDKSWREINYPYSDPSYPFDDYACSDFCVCFDTSVYIDGVIYFYNWLTKVDYPNFHIVAFEVGSETYSLIPLPAEVSSSWEHYVFYSSASEKYHFLNPSFAFLQVDGGRLAIVHVFQTDPLFYMDVWIWEKSKKCWEKITMTIPFVKCRETILLEDGRNIKGGSIFLRHTTNHVGEIVLLFTNRERLFILVCNLKSEVWRKFDVGAVEKFPMLCSLDFRMFGTMDNVLSLK